MRERLLFVVLLVLGLGALIYFRIRESRYLKKKVRQTVSPRLKEEIEAERNKVLEKKKKFEEALRRVKGT